MAQRVSVFICTTLYWATWWAVILMARNDGLMQTPVIFPVVLWILANVVVGCALMAEAFKWLRKNL